MQFRAFTLHNQVQSAAPCQATASILLHAPQEEDDLNECEAEMDDRKQPTKTLPVQSEVFHVPGGDGRTCDAPPIWHQVTGL